MNILIIEDSSTILRLTERTLTSYGYIVHTSGSDHKLIPLIQTAPFEIIIINTALEHKDSIELCKKIRKLKPRIFLIGINHKGSWKDRTSFLNCGGDDCISFPFPTQELIARIQAMMRRPKTKADPKLKYGNIKVVPHKKKAFYQKSELDLTQKEFNLLEYFVRNKERPITRAELLDHVWDYKKITGSNTVDVHVQKLRRKIIKKRRKKGQKNKDVKARSGKSEETKIMDKNNKGNKTKHKEIAKQPNGKRSEETRNATSNTSGSNQTQASKNGSAPAQNYIDKSNISAAGYMESPNQIASCTEIKTVHGIGYKLQKIEHPKSYLDPENLPSLK